MGHIIAKGNLFTSVTANSRDMLFDIIAKNLVESLQKHLIREFDRSVQLAALVGQRADQEALRAIYRSIKVEIKERDPLRLEAKFKDDYSHWYGGEELPEDIAEMLQKIIDEGIAEWFNTPKPGEIIKEALVAV